MMYESKRANTVRRVVQVAFVLCYMSFMAASIHKVAFFFDIHDGSDSGMFGAYSQAAAFDVIALVATIAVMFFRKSMPGKIQFLVWMFILGIAAFSYTVNWEYDVRFQSVALTMQPTGDTIAVYDKSGVLHYVPEMVQNVRLMWINPLLAATPPIFSLIYSVVAEAFGKKPPTADELREHEKYLIEVKAVRDSIKELEDRDDSAADEARPLLLGVRKGIGAARAIGSELSLGRMSSDQKKLEKLIELFNGTPALLEHQEEAFAVIDEALRLGGRAAVIRFWWLKVKDALEREQQVIAPQETQVVSSYVEPYMPEKKTVRIVEESKSIYVPSLVEQPGRRRGRPQGGVARKNDGLSA
jgi:hypothetical protein